MWCKTKFSLTVLSLALLLLLSCKSGPNIELLNGNVAYYLHTDLNNPVATGSLSADGENGYGSATISASAYPPALQTALFVFRGSDGSLYRKDLQNGSMQVSMQEGQTNTFIVILLDLSSGIDYTEAMRWFSYNLGLEHGLNPGGHFENRDDPKYHMKKEVADKVVADLNAVSQYMKIGAGNDFTYGGGKGGTGMHMNNRAQADGSNPNAASVLATEIIECLDRFDYSDSSDRFAGLDGKLNSQGIAWHNLFGLNAVTNIYNHMTQRPF